MTEFTLEIVSGPQTGRKVSLRAGQKVEVGRTADDIAILTDDQMSRRHFILECGDKACRVRDLRSTNGTFLNGHKITEATLEDGDTLAAGKSQFQIRMKRPAETAPPPEGMSEHPSEAATPPAPRQPETIAEAEAVPTVQAPAKVPGQPSIYPPLPTNQVLGASLAGPPAARQMPAPPPEPELLPPSPVEPPQPVVAEPPAASPAPHEMPSYKPSAPAALPLPPTGPAAPPAPVALALEPEPMEAPPVVDIPRVSASLYAEHLKEASSLYQQRQALVDNPDLGWKQTAEVEERLETHLDALAAGGDLARDVCKQRAFEGDAGELQAALSALCRQQEKDVVLHILKALDPVDGEKFRAAGDALNRELPDDWQDVILRLLTEGEKRLLPLAARVAGYRRLNAETELLQALAKAPTRVLPTVIGALGRLRGEKALAPLSKHYLQHEEEAVRLAAALALLRLGDPEALRYCLQCARSERWPLLTLGLAAGRSAAPLLAEVAATGVPNIDCLTALGLLGDLSVVPTLLKCLENSERADSAAAAMYLITAAEVMETVPAPEEDGKPSGGTITRLAHQAPLWQEWWSHNWGTFQQRKRYRHGKLFTPATLVEILESEQHSRHLRRLAYEELVVRYGVEVPFEADMFVAQQQQALAGMRQWLQANQDTFQAGGWYYAGQVVPEKPSK